jgi:hypothetical protein
MAFPAQLISYFNSQQYQIKYDIAGSYQFTVPEGVSSLSAVCIGGGGGGAGSDGTTLNFGTGGGGGGGTTWSVFGVQPGDVLTINVASGGSGGLQVSPYTGGTGGTSSISISSRLGIGAINQTILQGIGGQGGNRNATGTGGAGGAGNSVNNQTFCPIYRYGGGNGGSGGTGAIGASGGGGAGGYNGNGGNGGSGSVVGTNNPTASVIDSGGGGGGGGSESGLGYGGGGLGSFGFVGAGQGSAGINNNSGGSGASYFIDPNQGIIVDFVGQSVSSTNTINYPLDIFGQSLKRGDFLLLLSGSDSSSGITSIPVPVGFTKISQSVDGVYTVNSSGVTTAIIPYNTTLVSAVPLPSASRDLNFTSSYRYVPEGGLSGSLSGLTASSIHNMIAFRDLPNPVSIAWSTGSGDPALNSFPRFTLMPDPPLVNDIGSGSLSIAVGFLANTTLNPSGNTAGDNTININSVSGGTPGISGYGVGLLASYMQTSATGTYNPDAFLTGTTAHSRAYSIQINRTSSGTPVSVIGSAVASTPPNVGETGITTTFNLPAGVQTGDLLMYICASDSPNSPANPVLSGVSWVTPSNFSGSSVDGRGGGGLGFRVSYVYYTGSATQISSSTGGSTAVPAAHMVIVLRNATYAENTQVWDNGSDSVYGPPDPPAINIGSTGALLLAIGMIDNIAISNLTNIDPPTGYTMLAQQSYGVQNSGAIIMSAYKSNLVAAVEEDPSSFIGGGGNIWASQTIIIGGPGTLGTKTQSGLYGGGGGSMADVTIGSGMNGGQGSVRIIWGTGRIYPSSNQLNLDQFDSVP